MLTCPHCGASTTNTNKYVARCDNTYWCGRYVQQ